MFTSVEAIRVNNKVFPGTNKTNYKYPGTMKSRHHEYGSLVLTQKRTKKSSETFPRCLLHKKNSISNNHNIF